MSDDLVERLRCGVATYDDMADAADRIEAQDAEITSLRAALATAQMELEHAARQIDCQCGKRNLVLNELRELGSLHAENVCPRDRSCLAILAATMRAAASVSPGEYLTEAEQERDEFFNRLGRITEYLDIPVDATAQRIIEAIKERIDNEREACASVEVRLTVPEGAETWTPLEAWEEALLAFDEAFRDAIRAAAKEGE